MSDIKKVITIEVKDSKHLEEIFAKDYKFSNNEKEIY